VLLLVLRAIVRVKVMIIVRVIVKNGVADTV
jgi:hypothetical protein